MENENKIEYMKEQSVRIAGVDIELFPNSDDIQKVTFVTSKGNITWKPKIERKTMERGATLITRGAMKKEEFFALKTTEKITKQLSLAGAAEVVMDYSKMTVDKDGEEKVYRFIQYLSKYDEINVSEESRIEA